MLRQPLTRGAVKGAVAQVDQCAELIYAAAAAAVAAGAAPLQAVRHNVHISGKVVVYKPLAPQQMAHWRKVATQPRVIAAAAAAAGGAPSCELHLAVMSVLGDSEAAR